MDEVFIHVLRLKLIEETMDKLIAKLEEAIRSQSERSSPEDWIAGMANALGKIALDESRKAASDDRQVVLMCAAEILVDLFILAKERKRDLKRMGF
jgi:hypothetical protein